MITPIPPPVCVQNTAHRPLALQALGTMSSRIATAQSRARQQTYVDKATSQGDYPYILGGSCRILQSPLHRDKG
jgi:hypothetical protein